MKFNLIALSALLLLNSCATISISPLKTSGTEIKIHRGIQSLIAEGETFSVTINGGTRGKEAMFSVSIINRSGEEVYFDEGTMVRFQIGDFDKNHWESGNIYTATDYYRKAEKEATTSEILMAVAVGLSAANAGRSTSTYSGSVYGSKNSGNSYYGSYSGQIQTYDSAKAQQEIAQAQNNMYRMMETNRNYLENLSKTLLYSSEMPANSIYSGFVFAPLQKAPDMKLIIEINNEIFEFVFRRSDHEEVINPFIAYNRTKLYIAGTYSLSNRYGAEFGWLNQGISMYSSWSFIVPNFGNESTSYYSYFPNGTVDTDIWDEYRFNGQTTNEEVDGIVGINLRTFPYIWLSLGGGFSYKNEYRLFEELFYSYDGSQDSKGFSWAGQETPSIEAVLEAGLTTGIGPIMISGKYRYIFNENNEIVFVLGLAF
jgi:hypothetical protein